MNYDLNVVASYTLARIEILRLSDSGANVGVASYTLAWIEI